jgi:hypothetical protein
VSTEVTVEAWWKLAVSRVKRLRGRKGKKGGQLAESTLQTAIKRMIPSKIDLSLFIPL